MKMLKIEVIYDKGTAKDLEDGLVINPPFYGVIDGTSEPKHFIGKGSSFNKMSGGEIVRKIILETFHTAKNEESLEEMLFRANKKIRSLWKKHKIPLNRSDLTAGAVFAFVKIESEKVKIIQGGDCFVLWARNSQKIGITRNQVYLHELDARKVITKLMKKYKGDRKKMWLDFYEPLCQLRLRDMNKKIKTGYAILNGQPSLKRYWQKTEIPIEGLKLLLLFTDGLVPLKKENELAGEVLKLYKKGGLSNVLQMARNFEERREKKSYRVSDEATAIAIKFT